MGAPGSDRDGDLFAEGCDGCIASDAEAAAKAGASRQEAAEAIGVIFLGRGATPQAVRSVSPPWVADQVREERVPR